MSAKVEVEWNSDSIKKLKEKFSFTKKDIDNVGGKLLIALAERLRELIEEKSPFDTGVYVSDWKVNDVKNNTISVSNPDNKLFMILEFTGRKKGRIHGKPFLHFTINGIDIIVAFIDHPGTQPEPHVRPALEQLGREAKKIIIDIIKKEFPMFK